MERLTSHFDYCKLIDCQFRNEELAKKNQCEFFTATSRDKCHEKAVYEKLRNYEDLEEQGLLLKLPCNVGDIVWSIVSMSGWYLRKKDMPYQAKVVFIGLNNSEEMGGGLFNVSYEKNLYMMSFNFSDIGKTVFLTKEEAEEKLKELQNE